MTSLLPTFLPTFDCIISFRQIFLTRDLNQILTGILEKVKRKGNFEELLKKHKDRGLFKVNLELTISGVTWKIKYQFVLETGIGKPGF